MQLYILSIVEDTKELPWQELLLSQNSSEG